MAATLDRATDGSQLPHDDLERGILWAWSLCATQLRTSFGGVVGLDYAGCRAVLELWGLWTQEVVQGLQCFEREFVTRAAKQAKERRSRDDDDDGTWDPDAKIDG